jgi:hypothetical protein
MNSQSGHRTILYDEAPRKHALIESGAMLLCSYFKEPVSYIDALRRSLNRPRVGLKRLIFFCTIAVLGVFALVFITSTRFWDDDHAVRMYAKTYTRAASLPDTFERRALDALEARLRSSSSYRHGESVLFAINGRRHGNGKPFPNCDDDDEDCWERYQCGEIEECG